MSQILPPLPNSMHHYFLFTLPTSFFLQIFTKDFFCANYLGDARGSRESKINTTLYKACSLAWKTDNPIIIQIVLHAIKGGFQKCGDILQISNLVSKLLWICGWLFKVLYPGSSGLHRGPWKSSCVFVEDWSYVNNSSNDWNVLAPLQFPQDLSRLNHCSLTESVSKSLMSLKCLAWTRQNIWSQEIPQILHFPFLEIRMRVDFFACMESIFEVSILFSYLQTPWHQCK